MPTTFKSFTFKEKESMSRKPLIRTNLFPYHVTARTINKEWFEIPISEVWKISLFCLKKAHSKYPIELISFVLMGNHYHLLLKTPHSNLDKFMYEFNKNLAQMILKRSGRINRIFGDRYKWCLIRNQSYLYNCYRYIYQNPTRAKLVKECQNYPYSTLYYIVNNKKFSIPILDIFGFKDEYALYWLNQKISQDETDSIRSALKKFELTKVISRQTRKNLEGFKMQC